MSKSTPRITFLGNNSGRNLGDAAIMSSLLESFSEELPEAEYYVPTISPKWIKKHYGDQYKVRPLDAMPWTGSIRLLGIPTLWAISRSRVTLICDGIIFGVKLFNPAFNYLITLIFLVPWARLVGSKVVCFSCGIGPFPGFWSKHFARWVMNLSDTVIMRDEDSARLAREIGVTKEITVTGDPAFINPVSSKERAQKIASEQGIDFSKPTIGINVTKYIDTWLSGNEKVSGRGAYIDMLAEGFLAAQKESEEEFQYLVFSTQPMDEQVSNQLATAIGAKVIDNSKYLSHDIQAIMRECVLLIGMRFHSLVLASAVNLPVIGLVYAPKVRGYMRLLNCEQYSLELGKVTPAVLSKVLLKGFHQRAELLKRQLVLVEELKTGARRATGEVARRYFPKNCASTSRESRVSNLSAG